MKQYIKDLKVIYSRELDDGFFEGKLEKATQQEYLDTEHDKVPHLAHADYLEENDLPLVANHIRDTINNVSVDPKQPDEHAVWHGSYFKPMQYKKIDVTFDNRGYDKSPYSVILTHSKYKPEDKVNPYHYFSYRKSFKDKDEAVNYHNALNEELNNADNS